MAGFRSCAPKAAWLAALLCEISPVMSPPASAQVRAAPRGDPVPLYERAAVGREISRLVAPERATVDCRSPEDPRFYRVRTDGGETSGWIQASAVRFIAPPSSPTLVRGRFAYVGSGSCVVCHRREHRLREQDPHRNGYGGLASDRARAAGAARGVPHPIRDPRCLRCHVTAWGAAPEQIAADLDPAREAVGCEACHGPGSEYIDPKVHAVSPRRALRFGMTDLSTLERQDALCRRCHNPRSPTYRPFDLRSFADGARHWPRPDEDDWLGFVSTGELPPDPSATEEILPEPPEGLVPLCGSLPAARRTPAPLGGATPARRRADVSGEPAEFLLDEPPGKFGAVRFPHQAHAHRHQPAHSCDDANCHHRIPIAGGKEPRSLRCRECHARDEPVAEGGQHKAEEVFHKACVACHRAAGKGPAKLMPCSGCHAKK